MLKKSLALAWLIFPLSANSETLTFSDAEFTEVSIHGCCSWNRYAEFDWHGFGYTDDSSLADKIDYFGPDYVTSGYVTGAVGDSSVIYSYTAESYFSRTHGGTFDLNSAYLTSAWDDIQTVTLEGELNGQVLYSQSFDIVRSGPVFVEFNFAGIDKVTISKTGNQVVLDNFTVNEPIASVPVPAAAWLFGSAILGLGVVKRRSPWIVQR